MLRPGATFWQPASFLKPSPGLGCTGVTDEPPRATPAITASERELIDAGQYNSFSFSFDRNRAAHHTRGTDSNPHARHAAGAVEGRGASLPFLVLESLRTVSATPDSPAAARSAGAAESPGTTLYSAAKGEQVSKRDFEIIATLGEGSYGKVALVRKKGDGKLYAMKVRVAGGERELPWHTLSSRPLAAAAAASRLPCQHESLPVAFLCRQPRPPPVHRLPVRRGTNTL